ncbi:CoA transferase [Microbacterium aurantiacum]
MSIEQYISAPYCTEILGEAGAEIIKVERPESGDPRRTYDPMRTFGDDEVSGGFASYNRGKKSVSLDLRDTDDRDTLRELLSTADVLVSNLRPGALARVGLAPTELRQTRPHLIICEISGFGTTGGPFEHLSAFDSVIQAMSGMSSLIGRAPDDPPLLAPMSVMDILTGIWAAFGIATALLQRSHTGQGCHIDAAMYDIGAAFMERALTLHEFTGEVPTRGIDRFSPVGAFRAADGRWLSIVIPTDEMWGRCCHAIGRRDLLEDSSLGTVPQRAAQMESRIVPALEDWARRADLSAHSAAAVLHAAGQPVGVVQSIDEVRACEHLAHRGLFAPLVASHDGRTVNTGLALPRVPLLFDGSDSTPGRVPSFGEDNAEALASAADVVVDFRPSSDPLAGQIEGQS